MFNTNIGLFGNIRFTDTSEQSGREKWNMEKNRKISKTL